MGFFFNKQIEFLTAMDRIDNLIKKYQSILSDLEKPFNYRKQLSLYYQINKTVAQELALNKIVEKSFSDKESQQYKELTIKWFELEQLAGRCQALIASKAINKGN